MATPAKLLLPTTIARVLSMTVTPTLHTGYRISLIGDLLYKGFETQNALLQDGKVQLRTPSKAAVASKHSVRLRLAQE